MDIETVSLVDGQNEATILQVFTSIKEARIESVLTQSLSADVIHREKFAVKDEDLNSIDLNRIYSVLGSQSVRQKGQSEDYRVYLPTYVPMKLHSHAERINNNRCTGEDILRLPPQLLDHFNSDNPENILLKSIVNLSAHPRVSHSLSSNETTQTVHYKGTNIFKNNLESSVNISAKFHPMDYAVRSSNSDDKSVINKPININYINKPLLQLDVTLLKNISIENNFHLKGVSEISSERITSGKGNLKMIQMKNYLNKLEISDEIKDGTDNTSGYNSSSDIISEQIPEKYENSIINAKPSDIILNRPPKTDTTDGMASINIETFVVKYTCTSDQFETGFKRTNNPNSIHSPTHLLTSVSSTDSTETLICDYCCGPSRLQMSRSAPNLHRYETDSSKTNEYARLNINEASESISLNGFLAKMDEVPSVNSSPRKLARLALAIEEDDDVMLKNFLRQKELSNRDQITTSVGDLCMNIDNLRAGSREIHEEVDLLKSSFELENTRVSQLVLDAQRLTSELKDLKYLDDLIFMLEGQIDQIKMRPWPFKIGRSPKQGQSENFIV